MPIKYEDLKCEFCDGHGEFSRDSDGMAIEGECSFCNGTGIDSNQLTRAFVKIHGTEDPCAACGCHLDSHRNDDYTCPNLSASGDLISWGKTKFRIR